MEVQVEEVVVLEGWADQAMVTDQEVLAVVALEQESPGNRYPQSMPLSNQCCTNHHLHRLGSRHKSLRHPNYSNSIGVRLQLSRPNQHKTRCTS